MAQLCKLIEGYQYQAALGKLQSIYQQINYQWKDSFVKLSNKQKTSLQEHQLFLIYAQYLIKQADIFKEQFRYQEALQKYNEALKYQERFQAKECIESATTITYIGSVYFKQSKY